MSMKRGKGFREEMEPGREAKGGTEKGETPVRSDRKRLNEICREWKRVIRKT
jgi:hypothetical protein